MTRDEAIEEINTTFTPAYANKIITAMTEGATVSDKVEQEPCEDCISRTRAIERLKLNFPISDGADNSIDRHRYMQALADIQAIREMQSVMPLEWEINQMLKARGKEVEVALDIIKAKIRKGKYAEKKGLPERSLIYANGWDDGLEIAIDIIDKQIKEVSE